MIKPLMYTVGNRTVVIQRCKDFPDPVEHVSITIVRIFLPIFSSSSTSSTSKSFNRLLILLSRLLCERKSVNASAVVANPPGTLIPALASLLIISPREAFLPPTTGTSFIESLSNQITSLLKFFSLYLSIF